MAAISQWLAALAVVWSLPGRTRSDEPPAEALFQWYSPYPEHRVQLWICQTSELLPKTPGGSRHIAGFVRFLRRPAFDADAGKVAISVDAYRAWKKKLNGDEYHPNEKIGPFAAGKLVLVGCMSLMHLLDRPHSLFNEALGKMKGYLKFELDVQPALTAAQHIGHETYRAWCETLLAQIGEQLHRKGEPAVWFQPERLARQVRLVRLNEMLGLQVEFRPDSRRLARLQAIDLIPDSLADLREAFPFLASVTDELRLPTDAIRELQQALDRRLGAGVPDFGFRQVTVVEAGLLLALDYLDAVHSGHVPLDFMQDSAGGQASGSTVVISLRKLHALQISDELADVSTVWDLNSFVSDNFQLLYRVDADCAVPQFVLEICMTAYGAKPVYLLSLMRFTDEQPPGSRQSFDYGPLSKAGMRFNRMHMSIAFDPNRIYMFSRSEEWFDNVLRLVCSAVRFGAYLIVELLQWYASLYAEIAPGGLSRFFGKVFTMSFEQARRIVLERMQSPGVRAQLVTFTMRLMNKEIASEKTPAQSESKRAARLARLDTLFEVRLAELGILQSPGNSA